MKLYGKIVLVFVVSIGIVGGVRGGEHPVPKSELWLTYDGGEGAGKGKHVLLIAGDQEYRSEQSMPMLAKILAKHHGFHTTVLFGLNKKNEVDPTMKIRWQDKTVMHNIPGLEYLEKADLVIFFTRLVTLPKNQFEHIYKYLDSGKPIIGIRTANHGFIGMDYKKDGKRVNFGDDVLGGSFRGHHGRWHQDSTQGIIIEKQKGHAILKGVKDIWGPSDVYRTFGKDKEFPKENTALVMGQPLMTREKGSDVNKDLMALPIAWTKAWVGGSGKAARVFHVTMGSGKDYESEGMRRMTVNAVYWGLGREDQIDGNSKVDYVGEYKPLASGFNYEKLGVKARKVSYYR